jgi:hypothetical protein
LRGQADIPIPPVMFGLARSRAAWRDPAEPLKAPAGTLQGNRLKQQKEGS